MGRILTEIVREGRKERYL